MNRFPPHWQVPAYDAEILRPRHGDVAVCVFMINEGARLHAQLERMRPIAERFDVFLCDGGSTDGSTDPAAVAPFGVAGVLTKTGPGKLSAQMRMGLAHCLAEGYEGVVVIDGNNKDDPAAIPRMARLLARGYDHVQGSRFIPGGRALNTPRSRYFGVRLLHAPLLSLAAGFRYTDTTNGFRAYSRRLLTDPRVHPFRDVFSRYELHYYLAIQAARRGYRCAETPVTRAYPKTGKVPTKIQGWRGNLLVLRTLGLACVGRYNAA